MDEQEQQNLRLVSEIQAKAAAGQSAQAEETELFERNRGLVITPHRSTKSSSTTPSGSMIS